MAYPKNQSKSNISVICTSNRSMYLLFIMIMCTGLSHEQTTDTVLDFLAQTFCSSCSYSKNIFPRLNQSRPVDVTLSLSLFAITYFDEITGHLNIVGEIEMDWKDELVTEAFNESYHRFQEISLPSDFIWTPTISIFNSVDLMASTLGSSGHFVRINVTSGDIKWTFGVVSKTGCSVDATNYPFDVQKCTLIFTSRGYTHTEINFNIQESRIRTDEFAGSEEWNITETAVNLKVVKKQAFLFYSITLSRKPTFFMINIVLPIFLLAILNTLVFLLPAETGERIGYAIAAFLTFAVFLSLMSDSLPQVSLPMPLLSYYMLIMLLLSSTITFVSVFNLRFHFAKTNSPVPKYLKTLVESTICCNRNAPRSKNDVENAMSKRKSSSNSETLSGKNDVGLGKNAREIGTDQKSVCKVNLKMVGKTLDKIFLIVYWTIYICVSLVFYIKVQQVSH